ncbi:unnamed protein product, partial [Amoebophrya sp. A120]
AAGPGGVSNAGGRSAQSTQAKVLPKDASAVPTSPGSAGGPETPTLDVFGSAGLRPSNLANMPPWVPTERDEWNPERYNTTAALRRSLESVRFLMELPHSHRNLPPAPNLPDFAGTWVEYSNRGLPRVRQLLPLVNKKLLKKNSSGVETCKVSFHAKAMVLESSFVDQQAITLDDLRVCMHDRRLTAYSSTSGRTLFWSKWSKDKRCSLQRVVENDSLVLHCEHFLVHCDSNMLAGSACDVRERKGVRIEQLVEDWNQKWFLCRRYIVCASDGGLEEATWDRFFIRASDTKIAAAKEAWRNAASAAKAKVAGARLLPAVKDKPIVSVAGGDARRAAADQQSAEVPGMTTSGDDQGSASKMPVANTSATLLFTPSATSSTSTTASNPPGPATASSKKKRGSFLQRWFGVGNSATTANNYSKVVPDPDRSGSAAMIPEALDDSALLGTASVDFSATTSMPMMEYDLPALLQDENAFIASSSLQLKPA